MEARERLRERTTLQYYDIYSIAHVIDDPPRTRPDSENIAIPSRDAALTALAQLLALRLNVQRCLISLFDTERQYVIAEATKSLALRASSKFQHDDGDELWLSGCAISRSCGFCEHVLLPPARTALLETPVEEDMSKADLSLGTVRNHEISIISDLAEDERFKERPYIHTYPYNRFYVGCPIRTSKGIDIGVLCIFDPNPRLDGLTEGQQEVMLDVSASITHYLESNRLRIDSRRNERMVRGIGSFVEGSSTLAGWWSNPDTAAFVVHADAEGEGILDPIQQDLAKRAQVNPVSGRETSSEDQPKGSSEVLSTSPKGDERILQEMAQTSRHDYATGQSTAREHVAQPVATPLEGHARAIRTTFAKAANIIRESLEVEGVMFLDARVSAFGGLVPQLHRESTTSFSDASDANLTATSTQDTSKSSGNEKQKSSLPSKKDDPICKLLAFSTSDNSTINESAKGGNYDMTESSLKAFVRRYPSGTVFNFDKLGVLQSSESEGSDQAILQLREDTVAAPNRKPYSAPQTKKKKRRSKINDASAILKLIPGARSAVFFPLWDVDRQRWFSGAIAWSTRARPFTTRGELSYLSAFGNTIMSQIARLDALVVDRAKTDLLGSISHELRSPLHGVLGGVEILADTDIDPFQNDVLHTIETCGKTLLDTMDHLLDFAKINNFSHDDGQHGITEARRRGRHKRKNQAVKRENYAVESGMRKLFTDVELDILVEEVVESVCAGQQFFTRAKSESPSQSPGGKTITKPLDGPSSVAVILDFEYTDLRPAEVSTGDNTQDWKFNIVPGGFRRVLMNVFGNALKYTDHGSIRVTISIDRAGQPGSKASSIAESTSIKTIEQVVLRVTDTGRGISSSFLNGQMFLPFTQEDRLNPGTGLGLSIAQQIVSNLNGTIRVRSDVGVGTEFTITLPLPRSNKQPRSRESSDTTHSSSGKELNDHIKAVKGLRVALVGFAGADVVSPILIGGPAPPSLGFGGRRSSYEADKRIWTLPRAEIESMCRNRLSMEILPAPSDNKQLSEMVPRPELLLTSEQYLDQLISDLVEMRGLGLDHVIPPIVAVCPSIGTAKKRAKNHIKRKAIVDFISQPCGPRKLADAFALSLTKWAEEKATENSETSSSPMLGAETPSIDSANEDLDLPLRPSSSHEPRSRPEASSRLSVETITQKRSISGGIGVRRKNAFLLVEDNPINMRILTSFMRKNRFSHDTAENGLIALEIFKEHHAQYQFVLMDISMPVMTGLEASREIRSFEEQHGLEPVTIIALTALASQEVQQEAFASGINLFLTKPVRLKELGEIIKSSRRSSDDSLT